MFLSLYKQFFWATGVLGVGQVIARGGQQKAYQDLSRTATRRGLFVKAV